jgi:hypothetical protein
LIGVLLVRGMPGDTTTRLGTAGLSVGGELLLSTAGSVTSTALAELARTRGSPMVIALREITPEVGVGGCSIEGGRLVDEGSVRLDTFAEFGAVGVERASGDARGLDSGERRRGDIMGRGEERGELMGLSLSM